jgi:hypothetical protein
VSALLERARAAIAEGQAAAGQIGRAFEGRINVYACTPPLMPSSTIKSGCGYWIVTVDRHAGVTPMFVKCGHCGGMATSRMYKVGDGLTPTHEWFRPKSLREIPRSYRNDGALGHIARGGLLLRSVGKKDEWLAPTPETTAFVKEEQARLAAVLGGAE